MRSVPLNLARTSTASGPACHMTYIVQSCCDGQDQNHRKPCPPPRSILPLEAAGATIERNIRELLSRNYEVGRGGAASLKLALVSLHGLQIHHPCASKMVRRPA